jgi:hypothetical protein
VELRRCPPHVGICGHHRRGLQGRHGPDANTQLQRHQEFGIVIESGCLETGLTRELPRKGIRRNCLELCACVTP